MPKKNSHGFTLLELIVAVAILAILAVLGWRGLDSIVRSRIALTTQMEQTYGMQLTFAQLESDCAHIAPKLLMTTRPYLAAQPGRLLIVRLVLGEQQPTRLQVVDYRLRDGRLSRRESMPTRDLRVLDDLWAEALNDDGVGDSRSVLLQSNITALQIQAWDRDIQSWQPATAINVSSPDSNSWAGLQVALQLAGQDSAMTRIFLLGAS